MFRLIFLAILLQWPNSKPYYFLGDQIIFTYSGQVIRSIYVSGNFNEWCKDDPTWEMKFDPNAKSWQLTVPKHKIKAHPKGFYEFTFRVDGILIDASKESESVIHCPGYGYRYIIENP